MKRFFLGKLKQWKDSPLRKPLILRGLRQTGKTWRLREFANTSFPDGLRLIDFEHSRKWQSVFEADLDPMRIITVSSFDGLIRFTACSIAGRPIRCRR